VEGGICPESRCRSLESGCHEIPSVKRWKGWIWGPWEALAAAAGLWLVFRHDHESYVQDLRGEYMLSQKNGVRIKTGKSVLKPVNTRKILAWERAGKKLYEIGWNGESLPGIEVARKPAFPFVWLEQVLKNGNQFEGTIRVFPRQGGKPS
jgi:hypothetical protein